MGDFFSFRDMITSSWVKFIYFIGAIVITVYGTVFLCDLTTWNLIAGLSLLVLGNLLWRIFCEGMIILFSIYENLVSINETIKNVSSQLAVKKTVGKMECSHCHQMIDNDSKTCPRCGTKL